MSTNIQRRRSIEPGVAFGWAQPASPSRDAQQQRACSPAESTHHSAQQSPPMSHERSGGPLSPLNLKSDYVVPPMALDYLYDITLTMHEAYTSNPGSFENISSKACIETYATYYLSGHGNLLLITDDNAAEVVPIVPTWYEYDLPSDNMNTPFKWQVQAQSSALSPNALIPEQDVPERRLQDPGGDEEAEHKSVDSEWYNSQLLLVPDAGRALQIAILGSNISCCHHLQRHQMGRHVLRGLAPTRDHTCHFRRRNC